MKNTRNFQRDTYIYNERKYKKRTLTSLSDELGIGPERVRQIYVREDRERNGFNSDVWKKYFEKNPHNAGKPVGEWTGPPSRPVLFLIKGKK